MQAFNVYILIFITLNSLYVEASGGLFVHYIVNHVLFGLYIQLYAGQVSCLLLQIVFPYVLGDLQQFFLRVGLSTELNADLTLYSVFLATGFLASALQVLPSWSLS